MCVESSATVSGAKGQVVHTTQAVGQVEYGDQTAGQTGYDTEGGLVPKPPTVPNHTAQPHQQLEDLATLGWAPGATIQPSVADSETRSAVCSA